MPVTFKTYLSGDSRFAEMLNRIHAPQVLEASLARAADELVAQMRANVSGPRPRRLDVVTGELRDSFATDLSNSPDSVSAGTPLFWAEFWELGKGNRKAKPFAKPALQAALERVPDFFVDELERARDRV